MKTNTNNFLLVLLFFLSTYSYSQINEISQPFLEGFSPEVKRDLQDQIAADSKSQNFKKYNSFSTMIYSEEDYPFFDLKKYIDKETNIYDPSSLTRFGEDLFKGFSSTFMPVSEASVSNNYILGPGDQLNILTIKGNISRSFDVTVNRNGEIALDQLGILKIAGLSLEEVQDLISMKADTTLLGTKAFTTISEIRDIQLYVIGSVNNPGQYTLNGFSTMLHALYVAGGPNKRGSFREIDLIRDGKKINTIDIYDLLIGGMNLSGNKLFSGDVIKVNPIKKIVKIYGAVNNPAIYELKPNESLKDILIFSQGLSSRSDQTITVKRVINDGKSFFGLKNISSNDKFSPIGEDEMFFNFLPVNYKSGIRLIGAFENPGIYPLEDDALDSIVMDESAYKHAYVRIRLDVPNPIKIFKSIARNNAKNGDIFFALSNEDIKLLNSSYIQSLFLNPSKEALLQSSADLAQALKKSSSAPQTQTKADSIDIFEKQSLLDSAQSYFLRQCNGLKYINEIRFSPLWKNVNNSLAKFVQSEQEIADYFLQLAPDELKVYQEEYCNSVFNLYPQLAPYLFINSVALTGQSIEGGLYPIPDNLELKTFLQSLNLLNSTSDSKALITGSEINQEFSLSSDSLNSLTSIFVNPGQDITISSPRIDSQRRQATITGQVVRPGSYYMSDGETISSLIKKAGGYKRSAFFDAAVLKRKSLQSKEKLMLERSYNEILKSLSAGFLTGKVKSVDSGLLKMLEQLKNSEATGRVVAEFDLLKIKKSPAYDMLLEHSDYIHIPRFKSAISIVGEVNRATEVAFNPKYSLEDYIRLAGGFTNIADEEKVYFIKPNGEIQVTRKSLFAFNGNEIVPGSSIYIPRDDRPFTTLDISSNLAPIISSFALTAASLASIND